MGFKLKAYGHVGLLNKEGKPLKDMLRGEPIIGRVSSSSRLARQLVISSLIGNLSREEFERLGDKARWDRNSWVRHPRQKD